MRVGFSFSTGGLLLPYHLGVLDCLTHNKWLTANTPIAGSSAGAIACASHACGVDSQRVLDATIDISDRCEQLGGARGRLLPLLREKLSDMITDREYEVARNRGNLAIAYRQIYPTFQAIHQTEFESPQALHDAVCHSSTFPFFVTNWPMAVDRSRDVPRAFVDGYFAEPTSRYGCPDFDKAGIPVDRTVTVCVFPQETVGLTASPPEDCISPQAEDLGQMARLFRLATQASSGKELFGIYESGYADAEEWCRSQPEINSRIVENSMQKKQH